MSGAPILRAAGLVTSPNSLMSAQEGALAKADNCVIRSRDVIESRRGFASIGYTFAGTDSASELAFFLGRLLVHSKTQLFRNSGGAFVAYAGTYLPPDADTLRMKFVEAGQSVFFTTDAGIMKLGSFTGAVVAAGVPKGLYLSGSAVAVAGGFLGIGQSVAYRYTLAKTDENGIPLEGAPSGRLVVTNGTGAVARVSLTITKPYEAGSDYLIRVWRTDNAASGVDPGDEMRLCYEGASTSVSDNTPEEVIFETLYTNENSGTGILSANEPPPRASDAVEFNGRVFLANTSSRTRKILTIVGVGAPSGVQVGDVITIDNTAFTATAATENGGNFIVTTSGTPAKNIAATAGSLTRAINLNPSLGFYAYYLGGGDSAPGQILIEGRTPSTASLVITASANGAAWQPQLPTTGTTVASSDDASPHRICFSQVQRPEAFPLQNRFEVGSKSAEILRILALRDKLLVAKTDGFYTVAGDGSFRVDPLDSTAILVGADTAVVLGNQIYCLTTQGVAVISDTGVGLIGLPIEIDITSLFGSTLDKVKTLAFGVACESERLYILALPDSAAATNCSQAYCWNALTRTWTRWTKPITCGRVDRATDTLYLGSSTAGTVLKERRTFTDRDYADESFAVSIGDFTGKVLALSSAANVEAGDAIEDADGHLDVVVSVNGNLATVTSEQTWVTSATIYKAIPCELQYQPINMGAPGLAKQVSQIQLHFKEQSFHEALLGFSTEIRPALVTKAISALGWGERPWGEFPWGCPIVVRNERATIPAEKQKSAYLDVNIQVREAFARWKLQGITLEHDGISERTVR